MLPTIVRFCLSSDESSICEIESFVGDTIRFIRDKKPKLCYYLMTFGYSYMCLCPGKKSNLQEVWNLSIMFIVSVTL